MTYEDIPGDVLGKLVSLAMEPDYGMEHLGPLCQESYSDVPVFELSLSRMRQRYPALFEDLVTSPALLHAYMASTLNNIEDAVGWCLDEPDINEPHIKELPHYPITDDIRVRFVDVPSDLKHDIGKTRGEKIGKLVAFEGVCKQTSDPKPRLLETVFYCPECAHMMPRDLRATFDLSKAVPEQCPECNRRSGFERNGNDDVLKEFQQIRVQEPPEEAVNASNPRDIVCDAEGEELVDLTEPGDRVTVVGLLKEDGDNDSTLRDDRLKVYGVIREETQFEDVHFEEEDIEKIEALAASEDLYETLKRSIAPSIYGHEDRKLAVALQLFGGVTRHWYGNRKRGDIHQLYIGEPGTGKSQLLQYARKLAPRAVQSGGSTATEVGLTATAVKEKIGDEEQWTLQAGSLVLADGGLITIDELDNFREDQQQALDMALSDGKLTVDKANVHATLNARCSALMAANPVDGRFNPHDPYPEQFNIPKELLNRCDLIWAFEDDPDEATDTAIATTMMEPHSGQEATADGGEPLPVDENGVVSPELFQKWIAYSRREFRPTLTEDAVEKIKDWYTTIRTELSDEDTIAIGPRGLDGARRLSQAAARAELSAEATVEHAELAISLVMESLQSVGVDPETGQFDADRIAVGSGSKTQQQRIETVKGIIRDLADEHDDGAPYGAVLDLATEQGLKKKQLEHAIQKLRDKGDIYEPKTDHLRLV